MRQSLGLDFGTTNTVLASASQGQAQALRFDFEARATETFRSALCFWTEDASALRPKLEVEAGPWAIRQFVEFPDECRFMQSLKSFAASRAFESTQVFGKRFRFEDLLSTFFGRLREHAGPTLKDLPPRLVIGRPVTYVGVSADAELAMRRYAQALEPFGFRELHYVYEPVAAAFFYARRLRQDATILVADFGGGTTDFSVMRFRVQGDQVLPEALAHSGVGVAGDNFDYRIIDNLVSPQLGKGSYYASTGKRLEVPVVCYTHFARWNLLSVMKHTREFTDLKQLLPFAERADRLQRLVDLIESDHSYSLYKAVSGAKERLSSHADTRFTFEAPGFSIDEPLQRSDFERWIEPELAQIDEALGRALRDAGLQAQEVDRVFLTGGTSFVPAVRSLFTQRFGADRIESGDEFLSIAGGLALIGEREDLRQWTVQPGASGSS